MLKSDQRTFRQLLNALRPCWALCLLLVLAIGSTSPAVGLPCAKVHLTAKSYSNSVQDFLPSEGIRSTLERHQTQVKTLFSPEEALMAKLLAIRQAKATVDLSYYIFSRDKAGYLILNEVKEALKRKVNVRIMVDSLGSMHMTHSELLALIQLSQKPGMGKVEVATINPPTTIQRTLSRIAFVLTGQWLRTDGESLFKANNRSHDKILLVDSDTPDMLAIIGSRNISDSTFGLNSDGREPIHDVEVILRPQNQQGNSSLGSALQNYYDRLFNYNMNKYLGEKLYRIFKLDLSFEIDKMQQTYEDYIQQENVKERLAHLQNNDFLREGFENSETRVVHELHNLLVENEYFLQRWSQWRKNSYPESLMRSLKQEILTAKEKITVVSPYPILSKKDIRLIKLWLLKNPKAKFEIITNSTTTTNGLATQAVFDTFVAPALLELKKDPLINERVQVFSFNGAAGNNSNLQGNLLHSKLIIIDGREVLVGTSNFDPRSRSLNSEIGVWLNSKNTVKEFQNYTNDLIAKSSPWGSPDWKALRNQHSGKYIQVLQSYIYEIVRAVGGMEQL